MNLRAPDIIDAIQDALRSYPRLQRAVLEINLTRGSRSSAIETRLAVAFGPRIQLLEPYAG